MRIHFSGWVFLRTTDKEFGEKQQSLETFRRANDVYATYAGVCLLHGSKKLEEEKLRRNDSDRINSPCEQP